ncbi:MAG: hypothetical protein ACXVZM_08775, partial [Terriglobales bacterium]
RKLILERAGHRVITVSSGDQAREACRKNSFDVVIVGQTGSDSLKQQIRAAVRQNCPSAKVLELYTFATGRAVADADDWLEVPTDVPPQLAERVTELANRNN